MRTRSNYGVTGVAVTLSTSSTGGFFGSEDLRLGKLSSVWPSVIPPTPAATAGWIGAGEGPSGRTSSVDRITFATDTSTASVRGPLTLARYGLAATGTLTDGWFGGGYGSPSIRSTVDRITYATDTSTASVRGPLSSPSYNHSATSDGTTYGWFAIGFSGSGSDSGVNRITYATDSNTSTARGTLTQNKYYLTSTGTSSYGWFMGGLSSSGKVSTVDRITYATDTGTASSRGTLSEACDGSGGAVTDSSIYGWLALGSAVAPVYRVSTVNRITYATDTNVATVRGPLAATTYNTAAACDFTYGWFASGYVNLSRSSTVTRITFANDTATSTNRGTLSLARTTAAGTSGLQ